MVAALIGSACVFGGDGNDGGSNGQAIEASPTPPPLIVITSTSSQPSVLIADHRFEVELAYTPESRDQGLAGRESMPDATGMLYIYESGKLDDAWMKGMLFPLDFLWIGPDCRIVDTHPNAPVPQPNTPDRLLPTYWSINRATYVLEINAGTVSELGIKIGDPVSFFGFSGRGAIC
jgi:uncharacterized membrane protein (UPF0127 family)